MQMRQPMYMITLAENKRCSGYVSRDQMESCQQQDYKPIENKPDHFHVMSVSCQLLKRIRFYALKNIA